MWKKFKKDFTQRFMNFETAKGVYMVPAGLVIVYVSVYEVRYLMQSVGALFGWFIFCEGLRKILVNRIKQAMVRRKLEAEAQSGE